MKSAVTPLSQARKVALLIEMSNRYSRDILYGIRDWTRKNERWAIRLIEHSRATGSPEWFKEWQGQGIIARVDSPQMVQVLKATKLPVVDVSDEREKSSFSRVRVDNAKIALMALKHLGDKGFQSLAYCGDPRFYWSKERGQAFLANARQTGLKTESFGMQSQKSTIVGSDKELQELRRWLLGLKKPVGILACFDERAQQVIEASQDLGLDVPDQVAVLGVDNDEVLCDLCSPPLSSLQLDARRAGFEAAELLSKLMRGEKSTNRLKTIGPVSVVERQSTDLVAVSDPKIAAALRFMRQHACEGINIKDVLKAVPISRTLFDLRFKELVGRSPHDQLQKIRINQAEHLLLTTELSIAAIGELCGFSSPAYFSTVFGLAHRSTPNQFRRRRAGE